MRHGKLFIFAAFGTSALFLLAAGSAQQARFFPDFNPATTPVGSLQLNGSQLTTFNGHHVLRLTPGISVPHSESSTTWFKVQQPVNAGFTSWFQFQIHNAAICCNPGDGLAFAIQNGKTDPSYGAAGAGLTARGVSNGGIGYTGILNSLAIEFDTTANAWDPTVNGSNHVAVQGCGTKTNGPVHVPGPFTIYKNNNVTSCLVNSGLNNSNSLPHLGVTCSGGSCADGAVHDVVVEYSPVKGVFTLMVWVDPPYIPGTHTPLPGTTPAINIAYNIDATQNPATGLNLALDSNGNKTSAWVGFTGSQTSEPQQEDIIAWEFTPHTPISITQTIQPGCRFTDPTCKATTFAYGDHVMKVYYFPGFTNPNGLTMTVTATTISRSQFYQKRLLGTPFINEQCVTYLGTGGNCIVYSVKCSGGNIGPDGCPTSLPQTCNTPSDPGCIVFNTSYYSADPVNANNADFLSADPIGSNQWQSIFLEFLPNYLDSGTLGGKGTGSDFVATFCVGANCPNRQ